MINFGLYTEIVSHLTALSGLTPYLKTVPGNYWQKSIEYLERFQAFSERYNLYISSDIALTVSKLMTFTEERQVSVAVKRNTRKAKDLFAVNCLDGIHKEIKGFIEKSRIAFEECGNVWRQVLAQAQARGLLAKTKRIAIDPDFIIAKIKSEPDLAPYYTHILGTIGVFNARAVLDTVMPELEL